jgi:hypothetical protein
LLATSNDTYIYDPTEITQQVVSVVMPQTTILATDRIVVYLYGRAQQNNNRLTFHFGGQYPSHTHSTMPSVTGTGVVKVVNGVFQSPATTITNSDVSASAAIDVSKLTMSTNRILGRTTAGTGAVEEISVGTGLSLSAGTLTNTGTGIGGSVGAVDNAVLRADVGTGIVQNSNIVIDDVATATQDNVAIVNASSATNSALVLTPKGTGAFILGPKPNGAVSGGNARGIYAVDLQVLRANANEVPGDYALQAGYASRADGNLSGAFGNTCRSQGYRSIAWGGEGNFASGSQSAVIGGGTASGSGNQASGTISATLGGQRSLADRYGMHAHSTGQFSAQGDAQRARFVLRCKTTTNTGVEMALDGATTYLSIPSGKIIACTINITGTKSDGSAVAHYLRQYCVKNVGGTSSEVYAPVTIGTDNAAGTTIALSANNGDDTLRILVTGIVSETWRWVASVDAVEVAYGT